MTLRNISFLTAGGLFLSILVSRYAVAEEVSDFHLVLSHCVLSLASTNTPNTEVGTGPGEPVVVNCSRHPGKAKCAFVDGKGKIFTTQELQLLEGGTSVFLKNDPGTFIAIDIATKGVVSRQGYVHESRPDLNGSKVCSGVYVTEAEYQIMKKSLKDETIQKPAK